MYCEICGKENTGDATFCGSCGQPISSQTTPSYTTPASSNAELASVETRLGALILDYVIFTFTLGIGGLIWSFIVWDRGQTPGKQILGIYAASTDNPEQPFSWGNTALREFVYKFLLFGLFLPSISFGIILVVDNLWPLWDGSGDLQTLHDKIIRGSVYLKQ